MNSIHFVITRGGELSLGEVGESLGEEELAGNCDGSKVLCLRLFLPPNARFSLVNILAQLHESPLAQLLLHLHCLNPLLANSLRLYQLALIDFRSCRTNQPVYISIMCVGVFVFKSRLLISRK